MRRAPEGAPIVGECAKLVRRHRILIKDDHCWRNQKPVEADQSEKGRGIQIAVVVNDEAGSRHEPAQKAWQGVLEPTLDEGDPFVSIRGIAPPTSNLRLGQFLVKFSGNPSNESKPMKRLCGSRFICD